MHSTFESNANIAPKMFDKPQQLIISLERLVLEAICFDFRVRYPLEKAIKLMKKVMSKEEAMAKDDPKNIYAIVWDMNFDMYKTYMPMKNTEFGMAYSMFELATRLLGKHGDKLARIKPEDQDVPRMRIRQGLKDLLELYTQYPKHTKVGLKFDLDKFLEIKIEVNKEIEDAGPLGLPKCISSPSLTDDLHGIQFTGQGSVTNRFVFDVDEARREQAIVEDYFEDQYEEVEIEIEEEIPEPAPGPAPDRPRDRRGHGGHGGHGGPNNYRGGGRGGHGHGQGHGHGHGGHHNQDRHGHDGWGGRRNDRNRRGGRSGAPY
jgi:CTD kinase subunit beta